MRIGMITNSRLPPREGIGFYVWNLARHLTRAGHQVQVISQGSTRPSFREQIEGITLWRPTFWPAYPWHAHLHGLFVDKLVSRLQHELDLLHLHSPLIKFPRTRLPTLVTVHTPMQAHSASFPANTLLGCLVKLQALVSYRSEREVFSRADKLTAVARSVAREMAAYDVAPDRVSILGNGVDTDSFYPDPDGPATDPPYFLTVGRLALRKGLEDLIECADRVGRLFPAYKFCIAGAGPLESALRADIARRKLDRQVILLGHIANRARLAELYRRATLYVHAAHYEGLPTVLLEAMACGRPVITTAVSGALDVVRDGENGLLIPAKQPARIAEAIVGLLRNPNWSERLGRQGLETVRERYSWNIVSRSYLAEYERLCSAGHS